jgi:hypothetical protein
MFEPEFEPELPAAPGMVVELPEAPMELVLLLVSVLAVELLPVVPEPVVVLAEVLGDVSVELGVVVLDVLLVEAEGEVADSSRLWQALSDTAATSARAAAEVMVLFMDIPSVRSFAWVCGQGRIAPFR